MKSHPFAGAFTFWLCAMVGFAATPATPTADFYVAPDGNDAWSGKLAKPNANKTDGPFASLGQARDAVRAMKRDGLPESGSVVLVREGTYFLTEPLQFAPEDSGSEARPVTYAAYPEETPIISGGRALGPWRQEGELFVADVPLAAQGEWNFRQLFVGEERQIRARTPNFDPQHPYTGGWYFVTEPPDAGKGAFGDMLSNIHTPGDTFQWSVNVPAGGEYDVWFYYGAKNAPYGRTDMAGRTTIRVDDSEPVLLDHLPDTADWSSLRWSRTAKLSLKPGKHRLRWTNVKGGGLSFDAFALCSDPKWQPKGRELPEPAKGCHVVVVQAEAYEEAKAKEFKVSKGRFVHKDRFCFRKGDWSVWPRSPDPEVHIFPAWGWVNTILSVDQVDFKTCTVHVTNKNCSQELRLGNRYFIENVFEAIDSPGEWFLDRSLGKLYLRPKTADFAGQAVVAPALDRLVVFRGDVEGGEMQQADTKEQTNETTTKSRFVEHIVIRGLTFMHTTYKLEMTSPYTPDDSAIWMEGARHCTVDNCRFQGVGGYAVRMSSGSNENNVIGNHVRNAGQGGVLLVGESTETQPKNNVIAGNTIVHCGELWKHVAGVYVTTGSGNRIANNTITDMPRYGVSLKSYRKDNVSHDNIVEYNRIERTNLETNDTGAIETLGRDREDSGNIIRYNVILDVVGLKTSETGEMLTPYYTWGIYLDDYSSGTQVIGNVVARTFRGAAHVHLGRNNVFENNIFVDSLERQFECNGRDDMVDNRFVHNIVAWHDGSLMRIRGGNGKCLAKCDQNLYWMAGQDLSNPQGLAEPLTPQGTWQQWRAAGFDEHSVVADPLFIDPAKDDYRLKPNSPALNLGFQPVPFDRIGAPEN